MNIVWKLPDLTIAITSILDGSDPQDHADMLKSRGDIPADWDAVSFGYAGPYPSVSQDRWRWNGTTIDGSGQLPVPQVVEALQGLLALNQAGLSTFYETWSNDPARTFAQKAFINKALTWKRDDPTLNAAASDLGLTSEQVDDLFRLAAAL